MQEIIDVLRRSMKNNCSDNCKLVPTKTYKLGDIIHFPEHPYADDRVLRYVIVEDDKGNHYFSCIENGVFSGRMHVMSNKGRSSGSDTFHFSADILKSKPHKVVGNIIVKGE